MQLAFYLWENVNELYKKKKLMTHTKGINIKRLADFI